MSNPAIKPKSKYARQPMLDVPPVGTIASEPGSPGARPLKYDWVGARRLLEDNPGLWIKVFEEFSAGMYAFARRGGPSVMHGMGGQFQVSLRNTYLVKKTRYGDLWMRWIPEDWSETDQQRVEAAQAAGEGVL